jgi:hypothetical protein
MRHDPYEKLRAATGRTGATEPRIPRGRLRHLGRQIHGLGPRPLYELLAELLAGVELSLALEAYARLPADFIAAHGGDTVPIARLATSESRDDDA